MERAWKFFVAICRFTLRSEQSQQAKLLCTAYGPCIVTASGSFKVACGEEPDARPHHFIGSDAVQQSARPCES